VQRRDTLRRRPGRQGQRFGPVPVRRPHRSAADAARAHRLRHRRGPACRCHDHFGHPGAELVEDPHIGAHDDSAPGATRLVPL
ncbi:uncharacterized protein METZ01_LOCUS221108, partial [marine metagenome]